MHHLLSRGNLKLGRSGLIWGFGLPSARADICVGISNTCSRVCHARQVERFRPAVLRAYERNYALSRTREFVNAVVAFIRLNEVRVVRIHTGGDFYSARYCRRWMRIIRRLPAVRFYAYSRSWRDSDILPLLEEMTNLSNFRLWYSCDEETGIPTSIPDRVRVAWLMTRADEQPGGDLVFRVRPLRSHPSRRINLVLVCPTENGITGQASDCGQCGICWK